MKHILVVEDNPAIRDLLVEILGEHGYSVAAVQSGREALSAMHQHLPDLVLLDLMLPDMNGWTFLEVRERERSLVQVPVLVISAAGPPGLHEAQNLGAPVFLSKPFDVDDLLTHVERLCTHPVRQCAWCGKVRDASGEFRLHSGRKLRWASHGICPECKARERQALLN